MDPREDPHEPEILLASNIKTNNHNNSIRLKEENSLDGNSTRVSDLDEDTTGDLLTDLEQTLEGNRRMLEDNRMEQQQQSGAKSLSNKQQVELQQQQQQQQQQPQKDYEEVKQVELFGVCIVALTIGGRERLCLAQISNTLLKEFSYNEIHNRRVALGITCVQCTPIQLEMLRRAGAMPSSSRRCGMITMREAERLCRSFLLEEQPPELPENFYFTVAHRVNYGCKGRFSPARYISSRAKCIECFYCGEFYSPNKFIFHSHRQPHNTDCNPPDSPNINSWRKHIDLDWTHEHSQEIKYAWEDVKSLFNGGTRRRAPTNNQTNTRTITCSPLTSSLLTGGNTNKSTAATSYHSSRHQHQHQHRNNIKHQHQQQPANQLIDSSSLDVEQLIDVDDSASSTSRHSTLDEAVELVRDNSTQVRNLAAKGSSAWLTPAASFSEQQQVTNSRPTNSLMAANRSSLKRPLCAVSQANSSTPMSQQSSKRFASATTCNLGQSRLHSEPASASAQQNHSLDPIDPSRCFPSTTRQQLMPTNFNQHQLIGASTKRIQSQQPATAPLNQSSLTLPYNPNNNPNFIYSQLYTQLMQPQPQPQQQQNSQSMDAQLALRHHLWTSLLANLQVGNQNHTLARNNLNHPCSPSSTIGTHIQDASAAESQAAAAIVAQSQQQQQQLQANQLSHLISAQFYQQSNTKPIQRHNNDNQLDPFKSNSIQNAHFHKPSTGSNS